MAYAVAADVSARLGRALTPEEITLVVVRLEDAERMIIRRIPNLAYKIQAGEIARADVVQVEADAVLRVVRNPDGYVSETDGNYTYQRGYDGAGPAQLEILAAEWAMLGVTSGTMFVITPDLKVTS